MHHVQCLHAEGLHRMAYWEWGDASNPDVLVCVHGLTRQGRDFDVLARRLSSRFRVICPDVVGRGRSDWLLHPMEYQLPLYVADMVTLVARLGVSSVSWLGTSLGGLIGMGLASLPGSPVRRLVLNDVGPSLDRPALARIAEYVGARMDYPDEQTAADAIWQVSQGFGLHTPEQWLALTRPLLVGQPDGSVRLRYDPAIGEPLRAMTPEAARAGEAMLWIAYDRITCPTLLLRGADSDLLSPDTAAEMGRRGPRARLIELPGVGHAPTFVSDEQIDPVEWFLTGSEDLSTSL